MLKNCLAANFINELEYEEQMQHLKNRDDQEIEQFLDQLADRVEQIRAAKQQNATDELTNIDGINFN